ncbi:hypothetical protein BH20GEM2_BH20GEM2_18390 [soil metagenome]
MPHLSARPLVLIPRRTRVATAFAAALLACAAAPAVAQITPAAPTEESVHTVRRGDTLWDIARSYLTDPFLWPEIFRINTDVVTDPARIYPGERLRIPGFAEQQQQAAEGLAFGQVGAQPEQQLATIRPAGTGNVPVVTPGDFYRSGFIAWPDSVVALGTLVGLQSPSVIPTRLAPAVSLYDKVYVTLAPGAAVELGDRLHFFRTGREIRKRGYVFNSTGVATVAAIDGDVATAVVVAMFDPVAIGDLALPLADFPVAHGVAPRPESGVDATLIAFDEPHILQSTQELAYLDVGSDAGVREGDEFEVYQPEQRRRWGNEPPVSLARLQVVRAWERTAVVRVTELEYPALQAGLPVRLVAKMP